jgi:hypothetical protein
MQTDTQPTLDPERLALAQADTERAQTILADIERTAELVDLAAKLRQLGAEMGAVAGPVDLAQIDDAWVHVTVSTATDADAERWCDLLARVSSNAETSAAGDAWIVTATTDARRWRPCAALNGHPLALLDLAQPLLPDTPLRAERLGADLIEFCHVDGTIMVGSSRSGAVLDAWEGILATGAVCERILPAVNRPAEERMLIVWRPNRWLVPGWLRFCLAELGPVYRAHPCDMRAVGLETTRRSDRHGRILAIINGVWYVRETDCGHWLKWCSTDTGADSLRQCEVAWL